MYTRRKMKRLLSARESLVALAVTWFPICLAVTVGGLAVATMAPASVMAQTAMGEIEGRAAPVSRRKCISGASAGAICNQNSDCPGSSCQPTNLFNISVSVRFNATAAQLTQIQNVFTAASVLLFDVTDGQAQLGRVTILNNSTGNRGHVWISSGMIGCSASTGTWGASSSGNVNVGLPNLTAANGAACLAHELVHLIFDARDEYESRAAGCGAVVGAAQCPDPTQGATSAAEVPSLMECCARVGTEICWGQAVGDNVTGGNHDATNVTEQSRCRSNRSVWDQVVWSWPNTFLLPAGAPDPGSAGQVHSPLVFLQPPSTARLVMVLDRSGSMSLDSPTRLQQLQTAALDIIDMAETGVELGVVSFSSTATDDRTIAALGANRTTWNTAVNNLTASGATNIGDGLIHANALITAAGGVTANTGVILMTDGRNNQPPPASAAATDLQNKIDTLLANNIPVWVTCNGDDLGLDSQCSEIATGTNGTYVDSADAAQLPERFGSFYEQILGRVPAKRVRGTISGGPEEPLRFLVEKGAQVVSFTVQWRDQKVEAEVIVVDPSGRAYKTLPMKQGRYLRVTKPVPGDWEVKVDFRGRADKDDRYVVNSYIDNQKINAPAALRSRLISPGDPFEVCSRPLYEIPLIGLKISGYVQMPNGERAPIELLDDGGRSGKSRTGDETADDGKYCAKFYNTKEPGAYDFHLNVVARGVKPVEETHPGIEFKPPEPVDFVRRIEISGVIGKRE